MTISGRPLFMIMTVVILTVAALFLGLRWPDPWGGPPERMQTTLGRDALLSLSGWLGLAWAFLVLPWSGLLALRMRARGRRAGLALVPLGLAGIAAATTAIGGWLFGAPGAGPDGVGQGPSADWLHEDFIVMEVIVLCSAATAALALIFALILTFDALRPDHRGIDQIFS